MRGRGTRGRKSPRYSSSPALSDRQADAITRHQIPNHFGQPLSIEDLRAGPRHRVSRITVIPWFRPMHEPGKSTAEEVCIGGTSQPSRQRLADRLLRLRWRARPRRLQHDHQSPRPYRCFASARTAVCSTRSGPSRRHSLPRSATATLRAGAWP